MTFLKAALCVVAVTVLSSHVAPSVDDNNRYLKVTPLRDGFRLAYTVFFGEIPGAAERRKIDTNRDSRVDDAEAKRFADKVGAEVAASIDVDTDGVAQRVHWSVVSPGMGSDAVAAGSFSIDLIAFVCMPGTTGPSGGTHRVRIRDQFRIPKPGETEVRVEDSPGVTIVRARVGAADDPSHDFKFVGPGGPMSDDGLDLEYTASASTPALPNGSCIEPAGAANQGGGSWRILGIAGAVGLAVGIGAFVTWRRARRAT